MNTQQTHSWSQLKARLSDLSNDDLLGLLHDLYALNADNRRYLDARFLAMPEERAGPYRRLIERVFDPNDAAVSIDLDVTRAALAEFAQTGAGPAVQIDLMLFYVEEGVGWGRVYGAMYVELGSSLIDVYDQAAGDLVKLDDPAVSALMQPRFLRVFEGADMIGWGLYDDFMDIYINCFDDGYEEVDG